MDKIEALYNSYIEQGLLSKATTLEQFQNADADIQKSLYDSGVSKRIISQQTDFDTFSSAWGEKKNPNQTDTVSELEDGSSVSAKKDSPNSFKNYLNWIGSMQRGIPHMGEKTETMKSFESGTMRMLGGLAGLPDKIAKADLSVKMELAKLFGSEEVKNKVQEVQDKINSLPEDQRTKAKLKLQAETVPANILGIDVSPVNQWFADRADEVKDAQTAIDETRKQYDTNIVDDIAEGNLKQAGGRMFDGLVESVPMMLSTVGTGGLGLAAVGGSVASDKMEDLEREGEMSDIEMAGVGALRGGFEAVGGKILQGIFKPALGKVSAEQAAEITNSFVNRMRQAAVSAGKEFAEESSQSLQEELTDALVKGEDIDWGKMAKNAVDGGLIGAFSTAPANIIPSQQSPEQDTAISEKNQAEIDRVREFNAEQGGQVELNIPAVETPDGQPIEGQEVVTPDVEATGDTGEVQAQGFVTPENRRDSSLGEGGAVRDVLGKRKKIKRFLSQTFSSEQGLDRDVVRVTERHRGRLTGMSKVLEADQRSFSRIVKDAKKNLGKKNLNEGLKSVNEYLSGNKEADVSFLSEENKQELDRMRERLDMKSEQLVGRINEQYEGIAQEIEAERGRIEERQQQAVQENNPLGLDFDVEYQYKSQNLARLEEKQQRLNDVVETIRGNMGKYLFRSYDAFADTKYIDNLTSKTTDPEGKRRLDNAIDFVQEDLGITREEAETSVLNYLDGLRNKQDFLSARIDGKMDAPFLRKRKDIPLPIRELLGESKDPIKNYVASYQNITQYLSSITYQQELAKTLVDLGIAREGIARGYTQFKTNNQGWDFLEGVYVPVEFVESMEDFRGLDPLNGGWTQAIVNFTGITKVGKTVFAPTTMARNFLSGVLLSFNAGFVPFTKNTVNSFAIAWGGQKTQKQLRGETQKLTELGVIGDGAVSGEIMNILNDMSQNPSALVNKTGIQKLGNVFQRLYALGDDAYKAMGYYVWKDRYIKAGHSVAEAEELAATRIRNGFPTYSKLPKNIQALRRFPIVGTFPSFSFEVWRTTINNFKFILQDLKTARETNNPEYRKMAVKQVLGMTIAMLAPTVLNNLSKALLGISDDEEEAAKNMSPEWQKDSQLIFMKTGDGNVTFMDATALFPSETILKPLRILIQDRAGRTSGEKLGRAVGEAISPFVGGDILWSTISDLHSNKSSYGQKIYDGETLMEGIGNGDVDKILNYILTNAGAGMYNNIKEFARANADDIAKIPYGDGIVEYFGEKESKFKEYTNVEAVLAFAGFRLSKVDYTQGTVNLITNAREDFRMIRSRALSAMKVNRIKDKEAVDATVEAENLRNERIYKEPLIAIQGYNNQEIPPSRLYQALKAEGISDKNIAALMSGIQPPLGQISRSDLKSNLTKVEVGRLRNELDKKSKTQNTMIKNTILFNEKTAETNMRNMGEHLYNLYGDGLTPDNFKNLDKEDLNAFYILRSQGLLSETANKDFGWAEEDYNAVDYYLELVKDNQLSE